MVSIWLNPYFYVSIGLAVVTIGYIVWHYIVLNLRQRTNIIIHMPDGSRKFYSYKRGRISSEVKILGIEKTQDSTDIYYTYFIRPECFEKGYWGDYIEYDYGHSEPINPKVRQREQSSWTKILNFVSGLLDTDLAIDLLLSQKFKDFVKTMLVIILIAAILNLIAVIAMPFVYNPQVNAFCTLNADNQTLNVIKIGTSLA